VGSARDHISPSTRTTALRDQYRPWCRRHSHRPPPKPNR